MFLPDAPFLVCCWCCTISSVLTRHPRLQAVAYKHLWVICAENTSTNLCLGGSRGAKSAALMAAHSSEWVSRLFLFLSLSQFQCLFPYQYRFLSQSRFPYQCLSRFPLIRFPSPFLLSLSRFLSPCLRCWFPCLSRFLSSFPFPSSFLCWFRLCWFLLSCLWLRGWPCRSRRSRSKPPGPERCPGQSPEVVCEIASSS